MAVRCLLGALLMGAASAAPSISSCGSPTDIFKHVSMAVSPDPVERGTPFTITVTGDLGTDLTSGTVSWDIDAKVSVFGHSVVDKASNQSSPFTVTPAARAGPSKLVVGPIALPGEVPGSADISGKVIVADGTGAQVACVALEFHVVLGQANTAPLTEALGAPQGVTSCGKSGDHMQGVTFGRVGGVTTVSGTLDEDVSEMSFHAALKLHIGIVPVPISLSVPVSYSPGLQKGAVMAKVGPTQGASESDGAIPTVTGDITWTDANEQEIACFSVGPSADSTIIV
eukprot:CAMPEP_0183553824 /NCGR_PEP_ID=MMETSP0371-20130417/76027_1 /TAXON_ID=268820 /ORGANISM="Peridinium aciculiferum, Strain PAER-2" /LENGTH=283 /DNA_ID=CAMNT_0025759447 /DNA_START=54 /DNA_END=905 /DNA_ORIENTATION=-